MEQMQGDIGITAAACDAGWPTKLLEKHIVLTNGDEHFLVIGEGSWAAQILNLRPAEGIFQNATYVPVLEDVKDSYGVLSITSPEVYLVSRVRGCLIESADGPEATGVLGFEAISERVPLLLWALRERKEFALFMLQHCAGTIAKAAPPLQTYSRQVLLGYLARAVAPPDEVEEILERYKKPRPADADCDADALDVDEPELQDLLEEMAISDQINQQDLKAYRDDIKVRTSKKLIAVRGQVRAEHAEAVAQKKAKAKARAAAKAKAKAERLAKKKAKNFRTFKQQRQSKKAQPAAAAAAEQGAPPEATPALGGGGEAPVDDSGVPEVHEGRLLRLAALQTMYQGQLPRLAAVAAVVHRLRIRLPGHLPSVKDGAASMCHREVGCSGTRARVAWTLIVRPTQAAA